LWSDLNFLKTGRGRLQIRIIETISPWKTMTPRSINAPYDGVEKKDTAFIIDSVEMAAHATA
jgi:hypothetical protein